MRNIKIEELDSEIFDYREFEDWDRVQKIITFVKEKGDDALIQYTLQFDQVRIERFKVEKKEIEYAFSLVSKDLISNLKKAADNLKAFSKKQLESYRDFEFEIEPGVIVGQRAIPIERAGVYVPGGRYPLISSLMMGVIPAKVTGVEKVVVCSPPSHEGSLHPAILVSAYLLGVDEIYKVGGVQAIAAMAYGTQTIEKVDKIVGPGNKYVNAAKKLVYGPVGIDFIAGPTEVLIIADREANPAFIAGDLIAQAEHDVYAKPILVTDSNKFASAVVEEIKAQLRNLKNAAVAEESLIQNGVILIVHSMEEAIEFANRKAPEHLALNVKNPELYLSKLRNYGSLFIGQYSSEVLGDYSSGLNHILPTNCAARYTGGLSVKDFVKIQTTLSVNKEGFLHIAPVAQSIAKAEGLNGHANSIHIRMKNF